MIKLSKIFCCIIALGCIAPLVGRSVIFEFKGAYFMPTDCAFKSLYDNGSALFGPELTAQLSDAADLYVFTSIDYFQKKGCSVGLSDPTQVALVPFTIGLKYFFLPIMSVLIFILVLDLRR